jgi:hypothetical protein
MNFFAVRIQPQVGGLLCLLTFGVLEVATCIKIAVFLYIRRCWLPRAKRSPDILKKNHSAFHGARRQHRQYRIARRLVGLVRFLNTSQTPASLPQGKRMAVFYTARISIQSMSVIKICPRSLRRQFP